MDSGSEYNGKVLDYTTDFALADRVLFLGEPLWRRLPGEADPTPIRVPWRWLVLPGPAIQGIWVSYLQLPLEWAGKVTDNRQPPAADLAEAAAQQV